LHASENTVTVKDDQMAVGQAIFLRPAFGQQSWLVLLRICCMTLSSGKY